MHAFFTLSTLTAGLVGLAAAQAPAFRFAPYGNGDTTCDAANLISPTASIPGTGVVGSCVQLATGTSSIQYSLLEGSEAGCTVDLFTNNVCNGPAISSFVPAVGETACEPPLGGGWESVRVTCP